jgi:ABC-type Zn uptake system ZnuABC Zn-binding protein ZnuA
MRRRAALTCLLAAALAPGCGSDRAARGEGTLDAVVTTVPLADIVRHAAGRRVDVTTLVPRGADPHRWRPSAADLAALREADLAVLSGGSVDAWAARARPERTLTLLPRVEPIGDDPHWWLDPVRVERAAKEIRNELARADVDGAGYYEAATADFLARLRALDEGIRDCLEGVPKPWPRVRVTHAGFRYFGARYDVEFRRARRGTGLWSDTLGRAGTPAGSYLGSLAANTTAIAAVLSRGSAPCGPRP